MKCVAFLTTVALAAVASQAALSEGSGSGPIACNAIGCSADNAPKPVCGTDGVTYPNPCELSIACKRVKVELAYEGPCRSGSGSGPIACDAIGCSADNKPDPVCGSDGVTYPNPCELSIACKRVKVELAYNGPCRPGNGTKPNGTDETVTGAPKVPAPTPAPTKSAAATPLLAVGVSALAAVATALL